LYSFWFKEEKAKQLLSLWFGNHTRHKDLF